MTNTPTPCEECNESPTPCPRCASAHILTPPPSTPPPSISPPSPAYQRKLQRFIDRYSTSRATIEQLTQIFDLDLLQEDVEKVLDWIENPRGLYPLEGESVLGAALEMVRSESRDEEWRYGMVADDGIGIAQGGDRHMKDLLDNVTEGDAFVIARKKKAKPCSSIDEYASC